MICEKNYEVRSVENKVCDSLKILGSGELDDDPTLLASLRNGHARIVRVGERRYDALSQW